MTTPICSHFNHFISPKLQIWITRLCLLLSPSVPGNNHSGLWHRHTKDSDWIYDFTCRKAQLAQPAQLISETLLVCDISNKDILSTRTHPVMCPRCVYAKHGITHLNMHIKCTQHKTLPSDTRISTFFKYRWAVSSEHLELKWIQNNSAHHIFMGFTILLAWKKNISEISSNVFILVFIVDIWQPFLSIWRRNISWRKYSRKCI